MPTLASRQIQQDTQGLYEHLIIIECKYWKKNVTRLHVDALSTAVRELNASKGVIFSSKGFQIGAVRQARHDGIDLFRVRSLSDVEWGLPGRKIHLYTTVVAKAISNINILGSFVLGAPVPLSLNLSLGDGEVAVSRTPVIVLGKLTTLEEFILKGLKDAVNCVWKPKNICNDGSVVRRILTTAVIHSDPPAMYKDNNNNVHYIPTITFDLGVEIAQDILRFDRATAFHFALAVENRINGATKAAYLKKGNEGTEFVDIGYAENEDATEEPLVNGSILTVFVKGVIEFDRFASLTRNHPYDAFKENVSSEVVE